MEYQKNGKKAKNGVRHDEQLLINYSGEERPSESDSDRVKPLELPPTRLRRPKSRKIRVSSSNTKPVFTFWNFCQVLFVVVVIGTMVCMVWFTIVLKTSLDSMKKRVSILETSDRSTSKECAERGKELKKKVEALQGTTTNVILSDEKHFKSLLHKISVLNRTVNYLKKKLKSPKSVSSINNDIKLLKKAMADTSREMTEITDKVTQLRKIAHLQNGNIKELRVKLYNVSVQIAKLSGQPTPRPVVNTATPPWLLRVPVASDSQSKKNRLKSMEAEQLKKNITSLVKKDITKIIVYVKKANKSVHSQVHSLQLKLSALNKDVSRQKALISKLVKKTSHDKTKNTTVKQSDPASSVDYGTMRQLNNLTSIIHTLTSQLGEHDKRFDELVLDVTSMNSTLHQHMYKKEQPVVADCNCSLDHVWKVISKDEEIVKSLKTKLDVLKKSVENHKDVPPTSVVLRKTSTKRQTTPKKEKPTDASTKKKTEQKQKTELPSSKPVPTKKGTRTTKKLKTSSVKPTTTTTTLKTTETATTPSKASQTNPDPTRTTKTASTKTTASTTTVKSKVDTTKRDEDDDELDGDLDSDQEGDTENLPPIEEETTDDVQ